MPAAYLSDLSRKFEEMGELVPGDNGQTNDGQGDEPAGEEEQRRWTERQGRELEFVFGRKHNQLIVDGISLGVLRVPAGWSSALGGYLYNFIRYVQNERGGIEELYRCSKRSKGCPAEIVLDGELYVKESQTEHSHFGNPFEISKAQIYSKAKEMISAGSTTLSSRSSETTPTPFNGMSKGRIWREPCTTQRT